MVLWSPDAVHSADHLRSCAVLSVKRLLACLIAAFIVVGLTVPVAAAAQRPPKVVIIVGPTGAGMTDRFRAQGDEAARIARRYTPDVVKIYSPNATWPSVRKALQGASVVVYMGHGNGWPSKYRDSLYPPTQNGFGLNPSAGSGDSSHQYFGEGLIARDVKLAKNAVVLLHHLCYASGNTEPGLPEGTVAQARQRVDNYAAGFIAAGAAAVAADAWSSPAYMVQSVLGGSRSIDRIWRNAPSVNGNFVAFRSQRSPGYIAQMDPATPSSGFRRSIVLREGLASRDVLAGGRGNAGASIVTEPDVPAAPSLAGSGIKVGATQITGVPSAGGQRTIKVPFEIADPSRLPDTVRASVRWDPIDVAVAPLDPDSEVVEEAVEPEPPAAAVEEEVEPVEPVEPAAPAATPDAPVVSQPASVAASAAPESPDVSTIDPAAEPAGSPEAPATEPEASTEPSGTPATTEAPELEPELGNPGDDGTGPKPWLEQPQTPIHEPPVPADPPSELGLVQPERLGDVVQPVAATVRKADLIFATRMPSAPGLYRLSITLHDAEGIAYDAATQALVAPMLIRIAGAYDARILATETATLEAGTAVPLNVRVANLGRAPWGQPAVVDHGRRGGGQLATAASVVGHWISLDQPDGQAVAAEVRTPLAPALEPGSQVDATLDLSVPTAAGQYLLVLDVITPERGSLAALGVEPTLVRVTVVGAP